MRYVYIVQISNDGGNSDILYCFKRYKKARKYLETTVKEFLETRYEPLSVEEKRKLYSQLDNNDYFEYNDMYGYCNIELKKEKVD